MMTDQHRDGGGRVEPREFRLVEADVVAVFEREHELHVLQRVPRGHLAAREPVRGLHWNVQYVADQSPDLVEIDAHLLATHRCTSIVTGAGTTLERITAAGRSTATALDASPAKRVSQSRAAWLRVPMA